jgi:hypothetical protein
VAHVLDGERMQPELSLKALEVVVAGVDDVDPQQAVVFEDGIRDVGGVHVMVTAGAVDPSRNHT